MFVLNAARKSLSHKSMVMVMSKEKTQLVREEEATDTEVTMVPTRAISGHGRGEN